MNNITHAEVFDQFRAAMLEHGITPPGQIIADGKIHRYSPGSKKGGDAGRYLIHVDGYPAGGFMDYRATGWIPWKAHIERKPTPEEIKAHRARMEAARQLAEAERQKKADQAAALAEKLLSTATEANIGHPYLTRKQITVTGNLFEHDEDSVRRILGYEPKARGEALTGRILLAPIMVSGQLSSIEMIDESGRKSALSGSVKRAGYWAPAPIPADAGIIAVGEGIATVLSVRQATSFPVIAALSSGNLELVARQIRASHPDAQIILCADLVKSTGAPDNHAVAAARAVGGIVAVPSITPDTGTDFNDQHVAHGLESVRRVILSAIGEVEPVTEKIAVTPVTPVTATAGAASSCNGTENPHVTPVTKPGRSGPDEAASPIPTIEQRPRFVVLDDWYSEGERRYRPGVWFFGVKQGKGEAPPIPVEQWISGPLHIEAVTRDTQANNIGRLLRFKTTLGKWREWAMPCELLAGDGVDLRRELLAMGVELDPLSRNLFLQYVAQPAPKRNIHCALAVGWTADGSFVLPDQVIGPRSSSVIYQSSERAEDEYSVAGDLNGWREGIAARADGNHMLTLGIAAAFAGPLLKPCHMESGGIHIVGDSSCGKTTVLECAASVWGGPGFKKSWRATSNGLEAVAALHSDSLLPLDEISEADGREVGAVVYMVANGKGKTRATRTGRARGVTTWRTFVLSTGERGIEASMNEVGHRIKQGQSVRLVDIPAARAHGAFDHLVGFTSGAALADALKTASITDYGHAGRAFLERLTREPRNLSEHLEQFKALPEFSHEGAEGQVKRVAARFALLALAGELATEYGVTGWREGAALDAAAVGFTLWRSARGTSNGEARQIMEAVSRFLDRHADSRFSSMRTDPGGEVMRYDRAGYFTDEGPHRVYHFNQAALHEALKGFDFRRALDVLEQCGALERSPQGERARAFRTPGGVKRLYPVIADKLEVGSES